MANHSAMRLGKRPRRRDSRTLRLARYLGAGQAPPLVPPASVDYTRGITDWGMMMNDRLGCCTIAAVGHAVQAWTANALGRELTIPDSFILNYYEKWDGYNPADPSTDQGGVELDVLNNWRQQGFDGQTLDAYVAIDLGTRDSQLGTRDPGLRIRGKGYGLGTGCWGLGAGKNLANHPVPPSVQLPTRGTQCSVPPPAPGIQAPAPAGQPPAPLIATAIWLFGGAYIGVELPARAQDQDVWDVPAQPGPDDEPGSWGGHAVYLVGYDLGLPIADGRLPIANGPQSTIDNRQSSITCITWGKPKKMTWAWFAKYCSEAYALVSKDWLEVSGVSPSGFDLATLENDLKAVTLASKAVAA